MKRYNTLFVCGRNQWRSPTAERIYADDSRLNCRSRGLSPKSRCRLTAADTEWAELIFVMEREQQSRIRREMRDALRKTPIFILNISDDYQFMDAELIGILEDRIEAVLSTLGV